MLLRVAHWHPFFAQQLLISQISHLVAEGLRDAILIVESAMRRRMTAAQESGRSAGAPNA